MLFRGILENGLIPMIPAARKASSRFTNAVAIVVGAAVCARFVRRRQLRWGATDDEVAADLPGDQLLLHADRSATRALTIAAPANEIWPWLAQMGQGRGGLYSYDRLENLIGCDIHSADRIVGRWEHISVGDPFRLHPDLALRVACIEPNRAIVVRGGVPMGDTEPPYDFTWAFVLNELPGGGTRLLVRERYAFTRRWAALIVDPVLAVSFVMTRKMLHGIRARAEGARAARHGREADACDTPDVPPRTLPASGVYLYWLPLGAGAHVVRVSGRVYEAMVARLRHRPRRDLYHSALEVVTDEARFIIEMTPIPAHCDHDRGVVAQGAVGTRRARPFRMFRYEIHRWRDGVIPDVASAIESPVRVATGPAVAYRVLELALAIPTPVWGRDELRAGEMWNSNSVSSWLLARGGIDVEHIRPPRSGRAPGWDAGLAVARRIEPQQARPRLTAKVGA
ncbi:MAG: hypothetical protein QOG64_2952 [Acidimicrobiaceae bacterium]|nr:hypothetical protein [Acidimicrobiaceae bacterium]